MPDQQTTGKVVMMRGWEEGSKWSFQDDAYRVPARIDSWRLVKVWSATQSELYLEILPIAAGCFADFFSCRLVLSHCSRFEGFSKVIRWLRESWTCKFLWSPKFETFRKWTLVVLQWMVPILSQHIKVKSVRVFHSPLLESKWSF
jgi:hypothetical protein